MIVSNCRKVTAIELCAWLGGFEEYKSADSTSFLTIEEVGKFLDGEFPFSLMLRQIANAVCSSRKPQRTGCFPPYHRRIPPFSYCHGRGIGSYSRPLFENVKLTNN